jgi:RimJ/RimL family protein N-acetyltransferase
VATFPNELVGERLRLHTWSLDDIDDIVAAIAASFDALHDWMAWAETMPTRASLVALCHENITLFDAGERWAYLIREVDGGVLVGGAGLSRRGRVDELEIGYWIRSDRTRRGYATEAARLLTTAAFDFDSSIDTVKISMDRANAASAAVPQKLGFTRDEEYEREVVTPGHSGRGVAWTVGRDDWRTRTD